MKIKLNSTIEIDLPKLIDSRLLIQANSGGGKSYAIRRIVEQAFGKVQIIILDPEGEFTNLRSKYDFIYIGKDGDAPTEPRSASLLASRLLELKASAIIDLYELPPQERKHFVRLFCEAMVNSPKELWHDVLVIIDEAHVFAPEKGESEALGAVIDLASRGRKRGFCSVLATQRPAKLNKDAAAECNNKLIGRASLDIDRKRAAEELGFTTKESVLSLRDLNPGDFYVFGPAISREVVKTTIGDVSVKPPTRGTARSLKTPPPSAAVKKILADLKDLPQEAEQEARTIAELKKENAMLKRVNKEGRTADPDAIKKLTDKAYSLGVTAAEHSSKKNTEKIMSQYVVATKTLNSISASIENFFKGDFKIDNPSHVPLEIKPQWKTRVEIRKHEAVYQTPQGIMPASIGKGEREILNAIAQYEEGMTTEHIAVLTGYKQTSRRVYLQRVMAAGYVKKQGENYAITETGKDVLGDNYRPLPTGEALREHLMQTLPDGEKKVLLAIMNEGQVDRAYIEMETGYKTTSIRVYLQRLSARKLIVTENGIIRLSDKLE